MKQAISYLRYSSHGQSLNDSERRQLKATEDWCVANGYTLLDKIMDRAKSASKGENLDTLKALVKRVEAGEVQKGTVLVLENQDRLSRLNLEDALSVFLDLINAGLEIVTINNNQHFKKGQIDLTKFIIALAEMQRSHEYTKSLGTRIQAAWDYKYEQVKAGKKIPVTKKVPFWLTIENDKYVFSSKEAKQCAKHATRMILAGKSKGEILRFLNEKYPDGFGYNKKAWSYTTLSRILKSPFLFGALKFKDLIVPDYLPAIITKDEFDRIQDILSKNPRRSAGKDIRYNLFNGLLRCPRDGYSMVVRSTKRKLADGKHRLHLYLACPNYRSGGHEFCQWNYEHVEEILFNFLNEINPTEILGDDAEFDAKRKQLAGIERELLDIQAKLEAATDALLDLKEGSKRTVIKRMDTLADQQETLEAEREAIRLELNGKKADIDSIKELVEKAKEDRNSAIADRLRMHLRDLIRAIYVHIGERNFLEIFFHSGVIRSIVEVTRGRWIPIETVTDPESSKYVEKADNEYRYGKASK